MLYVVLYCAVLTNRKDVTMKQNIFLKRGKVLELMALAKVGAYPELLAKVTKITRQAKEQEREGYIRAYSKLEEFLSNIIEHADYSPKFSVFVKGNGKLPFLSFSNAPIVNCMGMGECEKFCYSLRAFRYPFPQCRMIPNTILMSEKKGRKVIFDELVKWTKKPSLARLPHIDFRLYVDGDFADSDQLLYWMETLKKLPQIKAYGYSKSIPLFLALLEKGYKFPENYLLNESNGGKFEHLWSQLESHPNSPTRGRFLAVKLDGKRSGSNRTDRDRVDIKATLGTVSEYKEKTGRGYFICGGKCGDCTSIGHACGIPQFKNIDIVIPIH